MVGNRYSTSGQWTGISLVDTASDAEAHSLSDSVFNKGEMAIKMFVGNLNLCLSSKGLHCEN